MFKYDAPIIIVTRYILLFVLSKILYCAVSPSDPKLQPKAEPDAVVVYATLAAELPLPPPDNPYHPDTFAVKLVETAPILKPLAPPVVTVTLRLSNVINVPAFTNPDVNPTIPIPLVPGIRI